MALGPNAAPVLSQLQSAGLSKAGAAALVGNWMQESSLNPNAPGGGLAQWIGPRQQALSTYAAQVGGHPADLGTQVGFAVHELQTQYPGLYQQLRQEGDPGALAAAVSNQYERSGVPMLANRIGYAREAYALAHGVNGGGAALPQIGTAATVGAQPSSDPAAQAAEHRLSVLSQFFKSSGSADGLSGDENKLLVNTTQDKLLSAQRSLQQLAGTTQLAYHPASGIGQAGTGGNKVANMIHFAEQQIGKPYVWGGGHSDFSPQQGYDCSGFVSAVLHAGGYLSSPQSTQTLASQPGIANGPGRYVTIYDRTDGGAPDKDHVIIDLNGSFYESGGQVINGNGGVKRIPTPNAAYLSQFNRQLHPLGL